MRLALLVLVLTAASIARSMGAVAEFGCFRTPMEE
jgi:hypothetical protein